MAKKNNKKKKKPNTSEPEAPTTASDSSSGAANAGRYVAIALLILGAGVFLYASLGERDSGVSTTSTPMASAELQSAPTTPAITKPFRYHDSEEEARPFPVTLPPSRFQNEGIANTYRIAKDIPGVLAQQPCLCGCDSASDDHSSLLDCYIDEHASTCLVCMKEAILASQMTEAEESAAEIREAILRHDFSEVVIGN